MTLIIILITIAIEYFFGMLSKLRRLDWFDALVSWLDKRLGVYRVWNGPGGVVAVMALPLVVAGGIYLALNSVTGFLGTVLKFLFTLVVLIYTLGPQNLNAQVKSIVEALNRNDEQEVARLTQELTRSNELIPAGSRGKTIVESILVQSNERLFGVLCWFILLGPLGALLFRFSSELRACTARVSSGFSEYAVYLYEWLVWIPARLVALGYALSGSLTHSLEAWRPKDTFFTLGSSDCTLKATGLGALQLDPVGANEGWKQEEVKRIQAAYGLVVRTLVIWLTVLVLITLIGWIA